MTDQISIIKDLLHKYSLNSFIKATQILKKLFIQNIHPQLFETFFTSLTYHISIQYNELKSQLELPFVLEQFFTYPNILHTNHFKIILQCDTNNIILNKYFLSHSPLIPHHLLELSKYPQKLKLCVRQGRKFDAQQTTLMFDKGNKIKLLDIFTKFNSSFTITDDILIDASFVDHYEFLATHINNKYNLPPECLINAIQNDNLSLTKLIVLSGCPLTNECLNNACAKNNLEMVNFILAGKIQPTNECFRKTCTIFWPNQKSVTAKRKIQSLIIGSLIDHGYEITYEDLKLAIKYHTTINGLSDTIITTPTFTHINKDYAKTCEEASFYPYNFNIITTKELETECTKNNLKAVRQIVANGLKPTHDCLKAACKCGNLTMIKFIMKNGNIKPTQQCLQLATNPTIIKFLTTLLYPESDCSTNNPLNPQ